MLHDYSMGESYPYISVYKIHDLIRPNVWNCLEKWAWKDGFYSPLIKQGCFQKNWTEDIQQEFQSRVGKKANFIPDISRNSDKADSLPQVKPPYTLKPSSQGTKQKRLRGFLVCFLLFSFFLFARQVETYYPHLNYSSKQCLLRLTKLFVEAS